MYDCIGKMDRIKIVLSALFFWACLYSPHVFSQNTPQLAAFDACEDSAKKYSKIAFILAAEVKKISALNDEHAKADELRRVLGEINKIKDSEYVRLDKLKDESRGGDVRSRIYADTYSLVFMNNFDYAVSLALSNPNNSEIRFKIEIERDCKRTFM